MVVCAFFDIAFLGIGMTFSSPVATAEVPKFAGIFFSSFPSGHVWMWELDREESWALNNWCFWTVVLEKTLESPLDFKEIQLVHPKGN